MPEPLLQRLAHRITPASNTPVEVELGPFAISVLSVDIIYPQATANAEVTIDAILSPITRIGVYVRGISIWDMSGLDAFVIGQAIIGRHAPVRKTILSATTRRHILNVLIPFSRRFLLPQSGLPPIGRGEGVLRLEFGTVPSGYKVSVHAFGWKDHKPEWTIRCVRNTANITTVGDNDINVALAGPLLGVAFYESNPLLSADTAIVDNLRFMVQGQEDTFASVNLEGLLALQALTISDHPRLVDHNHITNVESSYTQNTSTRSAQTPDALNRYTIVLLDEAFDPDSIISVPFGAVTTFRVSSSATGTLYIYPIEMITIPERRQQVPA